MLLEVKQVSREYLRGGTAFAAVDNLSMAVEPGEYCAVIGHSGSGKSTLLNMITGMLKPTKGEICLNGQQLHTKTDAQLAQMRNRDIGYIMQGQNLLSNFTVLDNVCMPAYLSKNKDGVRQRAMELLESVGLTGMEHAYPKELSGGEMRRVSIARALLNKPLLIVADEPTSNLDPAASKRIVELFRTVSRSGTAVLVSTHDMEFLDHTDKCYRMEQGVLQDDIATGKSHKSVQ